MDRKLSYSDECAALAEGKGKQSYCNMGATLTEEKGIKVIAMHVPF